MNGIMKGINGEEILTCLILVVIGYFIAMMVSRCSGNGFSVGGQGWEGPYCDELRDPESQVQKVPSNIFDCGNSSKKNLPNSYNHYIYDINSNLKNNQSWSSPCPNGECTEDDCCMPPPPKQTYGTWVFERAH